MVVQSNMIRASRKVRGGNECAVSFRACKSSQKSWFAEMMAAIASLASQPLMINRERIANVQRRRR